MAYSRSQSSLDVEIQNLKGALAASEKKVVEFALSIATLYGELNSLKNNICQACKNKLAPAIAISAPTADQSYTGASPSSLSSPLSQPCHPESPSDSNSLSVSREPEAAHDLSPRTLTHPGPDDDTIVAAKPQSLPPKWSPVYHPEVKRALDFQLAHLFAYGSRVFCAKMSPDGQRLAIGLAHDGGTYIYELKTGTKICVLVDRHVKDHINILSMQFCPDGQLLATGASDNQIRIWDVTRKRLQAKFKGHEMRVNSIAFSPNGRSLVSGSLDQFVRIWNIRAGSSKFLPATGSINYFISVAFSPNGRYIAGGNIDNSLCIWDSRTHNLVAKWRGHTDGVWCTEFTPDGRGLMSGSADQTVKYWDVSSLGIQQGVSTGMVVDEEKGFPEVWSFLGRNGSIRSIAFFPGSTRWIITGSAQSVRVWDTQSGLCQLTLQGHMGWVRSVDVSRTQNLLVTASDDGRVALWRYELLS